MQRKGLCSGRELGRGVWGNTRQAARTERENSESEGDANFAGRTQFYFALCPDFWRGYSPCHERKN